ncbi:MAG: NTPase-like protein [Thermomicrobiales bacterium]|nr:NTPase-like protein [Thermomicrobiales bacterium]
MTEFQPADGRDEVEVAHEALIRHWPRLRSWLDEDRAGLLLRESIREAALEWEHHGRDESYLTHRGRRLAEAEALTHHPRFTLNAQEQAYLDAALAQREREEQEREAQRQRELAAQQERAELAEAARYEAEQRAVEQAAAASQLRQRLMIAVGLGALALLAAAGALWGFQQAGEQRDVAEAQSVMADAARQTAVAEEQIAQAASTRAVAGEATAVAEQQRARSRELAARAVERIDDELDLGLLLAHEAVSSGNTLEATSSLLGGLVARSGLAAFLHGYRGAIPSVAVSPDGALLATGNSDGTIQLWDLASRRHRGEPLVGHTMRANSLAFSPDGETLASGGCQQWDDQVGCVRGELWLWDVARGQPLGPAIAEHTSDIVTVAFSPDGSLVAAGGCGGWSAEDFGNSCDTGEVRLVDIANAATSSAPLVGHTAEVTSVAFAPDGQSLASAARDGTIVLWDIASRQVLGSPIEPSGPEFSQWGSLDSVVYSTDGASLVAAYWNIDDGTVTISEWTVATRSAPGAPVSFDGGDDVNALVFSPDRRTLATARGCGQVGGALDCTKTGFVQLWDVASGEPLGSPLAGHSLGVATLTFGPDDRHLVTGGFDGKAIVWDRDQVLPVAERLLTGDAIVMGLAYSPDGATLAVGNWDQTIELWDVTQRGLRTTLAGQTSFVFDVAFSPDGTMLASVGGCGKGDSSGSSCIPDARLWDVTTGDSRELQLPTPRLKQRSVAFSPDGRVVATAGCGEATDGSCTRGEVRLWDTATGQQIGEPLVQDYESVFAVAFSPDGTMLASGGCGAQHRVNYACPRGAVLLWDLQTRQVVGRLEGHEEFVDALAFDPSGRLLASASGDETIILWDVATRQPLGPPLDGHTAGVSAIAFSPDGQILASAGSDNSVVLWDVAGRRPLGPPMIAHDGGVYDLAFAPDGRSLPSGGADGSVVIWNVDQSAWPDLDCRRANRNLSQTEWDSYFPGERYRTTCRDLPPGDGVSGAPPPAATPV